MTLGRWGYRDAVGRYALLWPLVRDLRRARREGRLVQFGEYVRGLWDGYRRRPVPLERLGLR
jgi:hypothetical protein